MAKHPVNYNTEQSEDTSAKTCSKPAHSATQQPTPPTQIGVLQWNLLAVSRGLIHEAGLPINWLLNSSHHCWTTRHHVKVLQSHRTWSVTQVCSELPQTSFTAEMPAVGSEHWLTVTNKKCSTGVLQQKSEKPTQGSAEQGLSVLSKREKKRLLQLCYIKRNTAKHVRGFSFFLWLLISYKATLHITQVPGGHSTNKYNFPCKNNLHFPPASTCRHSQGNANICLLGLHQPAHLPGQPEGTQPPPHTAAGSSTAQAQICFLEEYPRSSAAWGPPTVKHLTHKA